MQLRSRLGAYLPDLVYGANDGIVTTFAIVSGVIGADLSDRAILALGFASLLADGFSMGTSNYLAERSNRQGGDERAAPGTAARRGSATFCAFVGAGAVALVAYVLPVPDRWRFPSAIALSAVTLFTVGSVRAAFSDRPWWRAGTEMLVIGAVAAAVAYGMGAGIGSLTDSERAASTRAPAGTDIVIDLELPPALGTAGSPEAEVAVCILAGLREARSNAVRLRRPVEGVAAAAHRELLAVAADVEVVDERPHDQQTPATLAKGVVEVPALHLVMAVGGGHVPDVEHHVAAFAPGSSAHGRRLVRRTGDRVGGELAEDHGEVLGGASVDADVVEPTGELVARRRKGVDPGRERDVESELAGGVPLRVSGHAGSSGLSGDRREPGGISLYPTTRRPMSGSAPNVRLDPGSVRGQLRRLQDDHVGQRVGLGAEVADHVVEGDHAVRAIVLIDHGQAAHDVLGHDRHGVGDVGLQRGGRHVAGHHVLDLDVGGTTLPHAADSDVPIGDDAGQVADLIDHQHAADVAVPHQSRDLAELGRRAARHGWCVH